MARARMDQLSSFQRTEFNNGKFTGSGGNPMLDPFRATALDLSYEKYFGNKGYFSAAAFYKKLQTYIFDFKDTNFDFKNLPDLKGSPAVPPNTFVGEYSQPRNGNGGKISGIELAVSMPLSLVSPMLDGFGVLASYAETSSAITARPTCSARPTSSDRRQTSRDNPRRPTLAGVFSCARQPLRGQSMPMPFRGRQPQGSDP